MGLGFWGLGFRVWGLGFRVWGLGFRVPFCSLELPGAYEGLWLKGVKLCENCPFRESEARYLTCPDPSNEPHIEPKDAKRLRVQGLGFRVSRSRV